MKTTRDKDVGEREEKSLHREGKEKRERKRERV